MRVKPGTLARILVHRALTSEMRSTTAAERAIGRLVARSRAIPGDAVELVAESRGGLER